MVFNIENVYSAVNADSAPCLYGYASNNIEAIKQAVDKERINLSAVYTRLDCVLEEKYERRFCTKQGNFSLLYPVDINFTEGRY